MSNIREQWLNNPAEHTITTDALRHVIGQYVVEAMQLIERDNLQRQEVLKNSESTSEEIKQVLNGGAWYADDYFKFLKSANFTERFEWFQKKGSFIHGYMPSPWKQKKVNSPTGFTQIFDWKQRNEGSVSEFIVDLLEGKQLCLLECATVLNIAHYAALLRVWGKERFDRCFSGSAPLTLPCTLSHLATINPIYLFVHGIKPKNISELKLGDKIGIKAHPQYSNKHPFGSATGWNLVCCNTAEPKRFIGFGMSAEGFTEAELRRSLIDEYNKDPEFDSNAATGKMLAAVKKYIKKQQAADFPPQITERDFDRAGCGFDMRVVRLDAARVKMVLLQSKSACNLFEVFKTTKDGARRYAMDARTVNEWKMHQARSAAFSGDKATESTVAHSLELK